MKTLSVETRHKGQAHRYKSTRSLAAFPIFTFFVALVLVWAWLLRDHRYLDAESGWGYALGITGGSLMLLLLLYPLRKRWRRMNGWLKVKSWFRLHMLLGVLGPACILLHSNFSLGSTNSSVALIAMLLVAGSGFIGRYFYGKFHYGLYGQQIELQQLRTDLDGFFQQLEYHSLGEEKWQHMREIYRGAADIIDRQQQAVSLRQLLIQRRWLRQMKNRALSQDLFLRRAKIGSQEQALREHYRSLATLLERLAGLRLFERLFGFWHVVHIPVFIVMICTVVVHIVVVHWY